MAQKTKINLNREYTLKQGIAELQDIIDSVQFLTPGENTLPTADPASAGALFITGSDGMNLGSITGSGFAVLCVSQG